VHVCARAVGPAAHSSGSLRSSLAAVNIEREPLKTGHHVLPEVYAMHQRGSCIRDAAICWSPVRDEAGIGLAVLMGIPIRLVRSDTLS
jgi:hypothetical protein